MLVVTMCLTSMSRVHADHTRRTSTGVWRHPVPVSAFVPVSDTGISYNLNLWISSGAYLGGTLVPAPLKVRIFVLIFNVKNAKIWTLLKMYATAFIVQFFTVIIIIIMCTVQVACSMDFRLFVHLRLCASSRETGVRTLDGCLSLVWLRLVAPLHWLQ